MMRRLAPFPVFLLLLLSWPLACAAQAAQEVVSIEGVTEYRLANGLRLLTVPDPSADTVTVHITYLVGSRHESYGEKGMAHLLEHLLFKGSKRFPNVKEDFTRRGARWNGTTSHDRTNYFETLGASEENLDWALAMEADRMVNAFISKADLESEMTVVRNEFEMGENNPGSVLFQRMQQLAFPWHNYGNPIIGARSDIERVPLERLQALYRTWYQPDNAVLTLAGRFDEARALELVGKHFGPLPRPARKLPALYTEEPTQDGERTVTLRRTGDNPIVSAMYRVPAASHPDYPALDVLVNLLGDVPTGRLHRALVQKGLASYIWGAERGLHDPGFVYFGAGLAKDAALEPAREALLQIVERVEKDPVRQEEVERAKTALLNDFEKAQLDSAALVRSLSEFTAMGDWRLFFLYRDRLRKVTLADVQRAGETYLRPANRVLGIFIPTDAPQRAEIPPTPDLQKALADYRGGEDIALGESFDPSPQNIEKRVLRRELANGIRVALLPKKTRGARVFSSLTLHVGDEKSLTGREIACSFAGGMLTRGTQKRTRAQLKDDFDRLNATVSAGTDGASIEVRREHFAETLRIVAEVLKEPAFPQSEFEELKRATITGAQAQRTDPSALSGIRLSRHLTPYPKGHPHYTYSLDERLEALANTSLEEAQACYRDLFGATRADFVAVGDFDADEVLRLVETLFAGWKTPHPFQRVASRHFERPPLHDAVATPDKANAVLRSGLNLPMRDDHPDFPAMVLVNHLLGGSSTSRIPLRVREKEGLSYSTYTHFSSSAFDEAASLRLSAIFAPHNRGRVENAVREELERAAREGFGAEEIEEGKKSVLEQRRLSRTQDRTLAARLASYLFIGRTFQWDIDFERAIAGLTPAQVNAVAQRHLRPQAFSSVAAGDFRSAAGPAARAGASAAPSADRGSR